MASSYGVSDVKKYRQVDGKDWWLVNFSGGDGTYSWRPGTELPRTPVTVRASMAELRRRWLQQQHYRQQCMQGVLWLLAGASLTLLSSGICESWEDLKASPVGWRLYSLTLPCCWWIFGCCFLSTAFAVAAIAVSLHPPRWVRGRHSTRSRINSRSGRSSSASGRRRGSPYGRRRRRQAGSSSPADSQQGSPPGLSETEHTSTTEPAGSSAGDSGSSGNFASEQPLLPYSRGDSRAAEAVAAAQLISGEGPLTRQLTPRPANDATVIPSVE